MIMTSLIKKSRIQTNGRGKVHDIFKGMVVKTIFFQFFIINDDSILNNWVIVLEILTDHNFFLSFGLIKYFFFWNNIIWSLKNYDENGLTANILDSKSWLVTSFFLFCIRGRRFEAPKSKIYSVRYSFRIDFES